MGAKPSSQRVKDDSLPDLGGTITSASEGQPTQFTVQPITAAIKAVSTAGNACRFACLAISASAWCVERCNSGARSGQSWLPAVEAVDTRCFASLWLGRDPFLAAQPRPLLVSLL